MLRANRPHERRRLRGRHRLRDRRCASLSSPNVGGMLILAAWTGALAIAAWRLPFVWWSEVEYLVTEKHVIWRRGRLRRMIDRSSISYARIRWSSKVDGVGDLVLVRAGPHRRASSHAEPHAVRRRSARSSLGHRPRHSDEPSICRSPHPARPAPRRRRACRLDRRSACLSLDCASHRQCGPRGAAHRRCLPERVEGRARADPGRPRARALDRAVRSSRRWRRAQRPSPPVSRRRHRGSRVAPAAAAREAHALLTSPTSASSSFAAKTSCTSIAIASPTSSPRRAAIRARRCCTTSSWSSMGLKRARSRRWALSVKVTTRICSRFSPRSKIRTR